MIPLAGDPTQALRERFEARLAQALLDEGQVTPANLDAALGQQVVLGGHLATALYELGRADGRVLTRLASTLLGLPPADPRAVAAAPREVLARLPRGLVARLRLIPFAGDDRTLQVATCEPWDLKALEGVARTTRARVVPHFLGEVPLERLLGQLYQLPRQARFELVDQRRAHHLKQATSAAEAGPAEDLISEASFEALYAREPGADAPPAPEWPGEAGGEVLELGAEHELSEAPPPIADLAEALRRLDAATGRREVGEVLVAFARSKGERVAVLLHQARVWTGWVGGGAGIVPARLATLVAPAEPGTCFGLVSDTGGHFLGPLADHPVHRRFLKTLGGARPLTAGLFPVHYRGRVVFGIYLDGGDGAYVTTDIGDLLVLAQRVPQALERLVQRRLAPAPPAT